MKFDIDMPSVSSCSKTECAYNHEKRCGAFAITIGDDTNPRCDTFFTWGQKKGSRFSNGAGVGACKVSICASNQDFFCQEDTVRVGERKGQVVCYSFHKK